MLWLNYVYMPYVVGPKNKGFEIVILVFLSISISVYQMYKIWTKRVNSAHFARDLGTTEATLSKKKKE